MVSFTLYTVKFLMIYRYLQNTYWYERGIVLLSIPLSEALAIAYYCRTDNVRAHADMKIMSERDLDNTLDCAPKGTIHDYRSQRD